MELLDAAGLVSARKNRGRQNRRPLARILLVEGDEGEGLELRRWFL